MNEAQKPLSTESYKGVRDFYPDDMAVQNAIFNVWKFVAQKYGYQEYNASLLEPAELYRAKSGEEIVNEQTYTFTDRGDREVTLRPEMTPTVARMIAQKKRELPFPVRWFSIPNLFRYEKPQRGRLREHWQLNVDVFGIKNIQAEVEIISLASDIMRTFGLKDQQYEIRINSRKIMNYLMREVLALDDARAHTLSKLIDRKEKMETTEFRAKAEEILGEDTARFEQILSSKNFEEFANHLPVCEVRDEAVKEVREVLASLEMLGITNVIFDQTLMRGFDYYTGIVFEIFDQNPANRRSLFGGGRYDDLLSIFGQEKVPAVGFGMGDVTIHDVLETYGILPKVGASADIYICPMGQEQFGFAQDIAQTLRDANYRTVVDYSLKKVGDQIKNADKFGIPRVIIIGEEEVKTGKFKVKTLATGETVDATVETVTSLVWDR